MPDDKNIADDTHGSLQVPQDYEPGFLHIPPPTPESLRLRIEALLSKFAIAAIAKSECSLEESVDHLAGGLSALAHVSAHLKAIRASKIDVEELHRTLQKLEAMPAGLTAPTESRETGAVEPGATEHTKPSRDVLDTAICVTPEMILNEFDSVIAENDQTIAEVNREAAIAAARVEADAVEKLQRILARLNDKTFESTGYPEKRAFANAFNSRLRSPRQIHRHGYGVECPDCGRPGRLGVGNPPGTSGQWRIEHSDANPCWNSVRFPRTDDGSPLKIIPKPRKTRQA